MPVTVAKTAGFCFGVRRAVDTVYEQLQCSSLPTSPKLFTLGEIIHNSQVVDELKALGAIPIPSLEELLEQELSRKQQGLPFVPVIIRSHGVARKVYEALEQNEIPYIDATCPNVQRIQKIAADQPEGTLLLIAGDLFHRQPLRRELKEVDGMFASLSRTRVVLIAGNHDYIRRDSYYRTFPWSENVTMLREEHLEKVEFPELSDSHVVEIPACGAREKSAFDVSPDSILHHPADRIVEGDPVDEFRGFPPTDSLRNLFKPSLIVKFPKRAHLPSRHRVAAALFGQFLQPFLLPELFEQFGCLFPVRLRGPLFQKSSRCKRLQFIYLPVRGRADRQPMLIGGVFRFRFDLAVLKFQPFQRLQ